MPIPAEVIQIRGVLGLKGVRTVRCKVLEGNERNKVITRSVAGPVKVGDILVLKESSMESMR
jgi:small subunit ribosomal protein S28e